MLWFLFCLCNIALVCSCHNTKICDATSVLEILINCSQNIVYGESTVERLDFGNGAIKILHLCHFD